jgi:predicted nuclease of predicted toxin-antitoxin system
MIGFYFDEHMNRAVAVALTQRGFQVVMAVDIGMEGKDDAEHLTYATEHGLVMVTFDHPFAGRTMAHSEYLGLVCLAYNTNSSNHLRVKQLDILGNFGLSAGDKNIRKSFWNLV